MNAPVITPATIRGKAALHEVRELIDQLCQADSDIADLEGWESKSGPILDAPYRLTYEELREVLNRRREAVRLKLENKGLKIAPDPFPMPAPALETEQPA